MALLDSIFAIDRTADVNVYINGFLIASGVGEAVGNVKSIDTSVGFPQPVPTCDMTFPRIPEWIARKQEVRVDAGYDGEVTTIFTGAVKRRRHTDAGDNVHCVGTTNVLTKLYRTTPLVFLATPADAAIVAILAQVPFVNYDIDPVVGTWTIGEAKPAPLSGSPLEMIDKIAQVKGNRIYESRTGQFRVRPLLEAPAPTPAFRYTIGLTDPPAGEAISDLSLAAIDTAMPLGNTIYNTKIVFSGVEAVATSYAKLLSVGVRRVGNPRDGIRLTLRTAAGLLLASTRIFRGALLDDLTYTDLQLPLLTRPLLTMGNLYQIAVERADPMILTTMRSVEDFDNYYEVGADSTHSMGGLGVVVLNNLGAETDSFDYDLPFTLAQQTLGEARVLSVSDDEDEDQVKKFVTVVGDTLAGVDGEGNAIQVPITGEAFTNSILLSPQAPELLAMTAELSLIQNLDLADEEALRLLDKNHRIVDTCEVGIGFNPLLELGQTIGLDDYTVTKKTGNWWLNSYSHHLSATNCNSAISLFGGDQSGTSGIVLPHPDFSYTAEQELIGSGVQTAVTFDGSASSSFDGQIVQYHWTDDYAGGPMDITTAEPRLTRIYNAAVQSSIQVQLEVTGSSGGTRSMTRTINITTSNLQVVTPAMSEAAEAYCMLSLSGGASWTDVPTPSGLAVVTAITYDPNAPEDPMIVMYGTDDGHLYRTTDDLGTLPLVLTDVDGDRFTSITPNVVDRAVVYASTTDRVYVSLDFGATWGVLADFTDDTYWPLATPGHVEGGPFDPRPVMGMLVSEPIVGRVWIYGGNGCQPATWFSTKLLSDPPKQWFSDITRGDVDPRGVCSDIPVAGVYLQSTKTGTLPGEDPDFTGNYYAGQRFLDGVWQEQSAIARFFDEVALDTWQLAERDGVMIRLRRKYIGTSGSTRLYGPQFEVSNDFGVTWTHPPADDPNFDCELVTPFSTREARYCCFAGNGDIWVVTTARNHWWEFNADPANTHQADIPTQFWKSTDGGANFVLMYTSAGYTVSGTTYTDPVSGICASDDGQTIFVSGITAGFGAVYATQFVSFNAGGSFTRRNQADTPGYVPPSDANSSTGGYDTRENEMAFMSDDSIILGSTLDDGYQRSTDTGLTFGSFSLDADFSLGGAGQFVAKIGYHRDPDWGGKFVLSIPVNTGAGIHFWRTVDDGNTWDLMPGTGSITEAPIVVDYDAAQDRMIVVGSGGHYWNIDDPFGVAPVVTLVSAAPGGFGYNAGQQGVILGETTSGGLGVGTQTVVSAVVSNRASGDLGLLFADPVGAAPTNAWIYAVPFYPAGTVTWQVATGAIAALGVNGVGGAADNNQLQQFGAVMDNKTFYSTADGVAWVAGGDLPGTGANRPHHIMEINAWKGIYFVSTDEGIAKSVDAGENWEFFRPKGSPFDTTWPAGAIGRQMYFEYRPPQSFNLWLSVWGGGSTATLRRQGASGWVAQSVDGAEYPYCRIHDFGIGRLYRIRNTQASDMTTPFEVLQKSDNEGVSWQDVTDVGACSDIAHGASGVLWALGGGPDADTTRVFKSVDGGDTWTEEYDGSALDPIYRCIAADVFDPRRIIAIGWNGVQQAMLVTLDEGGVWNAFEPSFDSFAQHTDMRLVLGQNDRIIVAYDAGGSQVAVEVSDNEGLTWVPKHTFAGAVKVTALFQGGAPLYIAYEGGVARSVDNGETWGAYAASPSPGDEHTAIWSPQDNILYLGSDPGTAVSQLREPANLPGTWVDCSTGIDAAAGFTARSCVDGLEVVHDGVLSSPGSGGGGGTPPPVAPGTRNRFAWPFAQTSIWNMPIGSSASYIAANILGDALYFTNDVEYFIHPAGGDPTTDFYINGNFDADRCDLTTLAFSQRFPPAFSLADPTPGSTPNACAAVVANDGDTLKNIQPITRCSPPDEVTFGFSFPDTSITGDGIRGSHGGSGLSSLGGSLRVGELSSPLPIRHALKMNLFGHRWLSPTSGGFRWPAVSADSYYNTPGPLIYAGTVSQLRQGALLAIPPSVDVLAIGLHSTEAEKLAWTMQNYGVYVVDDTAWDVVALCIEDGVNAEFNGLSGFDIEQPAGAGGAAGDWYDDMMLLVTLLQIVNNNSAGSIGGGGTPRQDLAPPFA